MGFMSRTMGGARRGVWIVWVLLAAWTSCNSSGTKKLDASQAGGGTQLGGGYDASGGRGTGGAIATGGMQADAPWSEGGASDAQLAGETRDSPPGNGGQATTVPAGGGGATGLHMDGAAAGGSLDSAASGGRAGAGGATGMGGAGGATVVTGCSSTATACSQLGAICTTSTGCCVCEVNTSCGPDPRWYCASPGENPAECPDSPGVVASACPAIEAGSLRCLWCVSAMPVARVCGPSGWVADRIGRCR